MATLKAGTYTFLANIPTPIVAEQTNVELKFFDSYSSGWKYMILYTNKIMYTGSLDNNYASALETNGKFITKEMAKIRLDTDQNVEDWFFNLFVSITNYYLINPPTSEPIVATITHDNTTIATIGEGQSATLKCNGLKMKTDIVISM